MGCPLSKTESNKDVSDKSIPPIRYTPAEPLEESKSNSSSCKIVVPKPPSLSKKQSHVQLYVPIYIARESYSSTDDGYLSFEKDDEMELIKEFGDDRLEVTHLRSGLTGIVSNKFVQLDTDTALRLALNDRGITNRCIMQYNVLGGYLIRRSRHNISEFVLSIYQVNEERHTCQWHYLIRIEPLNQCFYFSDEQKLYNIYFSSFHQLVNDERVQTIIPLRKILPYTMEFEEELWHIPFNELSIEEKIGEGEFGEVFRAQWRKVETIRPVAVKKVRMHGITDTVTREIEAMKTLTNLYIVSFYGISHEQNSNEMYLVTDYMENGDLKSWLKNLLILPDYTTLLRFARHITHGMAYLERWNYVHRDLACRNILVASNGNVIKIADFGLSTIVNNRDAERRQEAQSQKLAIRWSAPEVLDNQATYSIKSDVWSFGITLIEIWLKGGNPYDDKHPAYIVPAVMNEYVHEKPSDCPDDFYRLVICRCLQFKPNDRPTFDALSQLLDNWEFLQTSTDHQ